MQDEENFPASQRLLQQLLARQQDHDPAQQRQEPYQAAAELQEGDGPEAAEAAAAVAKVCPFSANTEHLQLEHQPRGSRSTAQVRADPGTCRLVRRCGLQRRQSLQQSPAAI